MPLLIRQLLGGPAPLEKPMLVITSPLASRGHLLSPLILFSYLQILVDHLPTALPPAADQEEGAGDDRAGVAGLLHLGPPRPRLAPRRVRGRATEPGDAVH